MNSLAMAIMEAERQLDFMPRDVGQDNCGYDIESHVPGAGKLRFIEVNGRADTDTMTVTGNETLAALNKPDDLTLAIVEVDDNSVTPRYVRRPLQKEPHFESGRCELHAPTSLAEVAGRSNSKQELSEMPTTKKRVFLSFTSEDKQRIQGLRLLVSNPNYDLEFYDESLTEPIDSENAEYIKQVLRQKINRTTVTVCLISTDTHKSLWVDWELEQSANKQNAIIAMALKGVDSAVLPKLLKEMKLTFHAWDPEHLGRLIAEA